MRPVFVCVSVPLFSQAFPPPPPSSCFNRACVGCVLRVCVIYIYISFNLLLLLAATQLAEVKLSARNKEK